MEEIWKDIKGYEGYYQVSNFGKVKSLERIAPNNHKVLPKILKTRKDKDGYEIVTLYCFGKRKDYKMHRLVAGAFLINKYNKSQVNHKDGNKSNNNAYNLNWCSAKENCNFGNRKIGKKINQYDLDGNFIKEWETARQVQKILNYDSSSIRKCCKGKRKQSYGYLWKNAE